MGSKTTDKKKKKVSPTQSYKYFKKNFNTESELKGLQCRHHFIEISILKYEPPFFTQFKENSPIHLHYQK